MAGGIRILYLAVDTSARLRLEVEAHRVQTSIRASRYRDCLELITRWQIRPDELQQSLLEVRPHILHLSGHGTRDGSILLQGDGHGDKPVDGAAIVELTRILRDNLRVVVLNVCHSDALARALVRHIDCAIGASQEVSDEAAIEFAAGFYRALGYGRTVKDAFRLGCNAGALQGIARADAHELMARDGIDPCDIVLVGRSGTASSLEAPLAGAASVPEPDRALAEQTTKAGRRVVRCRSYPRPVVVRWPARHERDARAPDGVKGSM